MGRRKWATLTSDGEGDGGVGPGLAVSFFCSVDIKVDGVLSCMDVN